MIERRVSYKLKALDQLLDHTHAHTEIQCESDAHERPLLISGQKRAKIIRQMAKKTQKIRQMTKEPESARTLCPAGRIELIRYSHHVIYTYNSLCLCVCVWL